MNLFLEKKCFDSETGASTGFWSLTNLFEKLKLNQGRDENLGIFFKVLKNLIVILWEW